MLGSTVPRCRGRSLWRYCRIPTTNAGWRDGTDGPANFDSLTAGGPVFVKFFTDWCPHCKLLKPLFPQLATVGQAAGRGAGQVNCETPADDLPPNRQCRHYPYMALFGHGRRLGVHEGRQHHRKIAAVPAAETAESWLPTEQRLSPRDSLRTGIRCSHCQRLGPVWERLAQDLAQEFPGRQQLVLGAVWTARGSRPVQSAGGHLVWTASAASRTTRSPCLSLILREDSHRAAQQGAAGASSEGCVSYCS
uniref:Thioredoxin domain-containing protein n=1 Tax=Macrostomum lignano TaxID=282301 RepID=A0A1I8FHE7_9PLAT